MTNIYEIANYLRKNQTKAEKILWERIRNRQILGIKFRRQTPLDYGSYRFIPDFLAFKEKLIIEVDGNIHDDPYIKEYDQIREELLRNGGYKIIRITNEEILFSINQTIEKIINSIKGIKQ